MSGAWGVTTLRMLDLLETVGPMTRSELCAALGLTRQAGASIISRLSRPSKRPVGPRRVHICGWRDEEEGQRRYPRAVYALGDKPDVRQPKLDVKAVKRRYWANRKQRMTSTVFRLAMTRREHEALAADVKARFNPLNTVGHSE